MKNYVHNKFEAEVVLNETHDNGEQFKLDGTHWFTYEGEFLFSISVDDNGEYDYTLKNTLVGE